MMKRNIKLCENDEVIESLYFDGRRTLTDFLEEIDEIIERSGREPNRVLVTLRGWCYDLVRQPFGLWAVAEKFKEVK